MARHTVPASWKTGMLEAGPKIFAYVQETGETGIFNSGLIVGRDGAGFGSRSLAGQAFHRPRSTLTARGPGRALSPTPGRRP